MYKIIARIVTRAPKYNRDLDKKIQICIGGDSLLIRRSSSVIVLKAGKIHTS